jgi:transaldolase
MNMASQLRRLGQSLWLDNISRKDLDDGTLRRFIDDFGVTGLTSNPTIFEQAVAGGAYDAAIREKARAGKSGEALFLELALEDLRRAADLFLPAYEASTGLDGWVSMEVSPLLAHDTGGSVEAASAIHRQAERPNLFVKIPGTPQGIPAIEESIFAGVPINVTLLFSREQYVAAADAYLRGIERRIAAGRDLRVASVASLFVSRWDRAVHNAIPPVLQNRLGIAMARRTHRAYRELLASDRWSGLATAGALPQRLLWASTGTKNPELSESFYVEALAARDTIDTMPTKTLLALPAHGSVRDAMADCGDSEAVLERFARAGIDTHALADRLQGEGTAAFVKSWEALMKRIAFKGGSGAVAVEETV